jgi:hypothetical protein
VVRGVLWPRLDRHRAADRALTTEAFGRENTGVIYGWIGASHQLGASLAAFGAGAIQNDAWRLRAGIRDGWAAVHRRGSLVS